jgi:hypothetical protein
MTGPGQSRPQRRTTSLSGPDATARVSCSAGIASSMRLGYGVSVHTYAKEPSGCRSQAPPVAHGRGLHLGDSLQKAPGCLPLGCNDMDATRIGGIAELAHRGLQGCSHGQHDDPNHHPSRDDIPRRRSVPLEPVVLISPLAPPKTKPAGNRHLLRERCPARSAPAIGRAFHRVEPVGDVQSADQGRQVVQFFDRSRFGHRAP